MAGMSLPNPPRDYECHSPVQSGQGNYKCQRMSQKGLYQTDVRHQADPLGRDTLS